jgi:hypothetical protein
MAPQTIPNIAAQPRRAPPARVCPTTNSMSGPGVRISTQAATRKARNRFGSIGMAEACAGQGARGNAKP